MDEVADMRRELGEKAAIKGDRVHEGASVEFTEAYRKRSIGFGSNVTPKNFGKGYVTLIDTWICVCGHENKESRRYMREGRVACWLCGTQREYGEDTNVQEEG